MSQTSSRILIIIMKMRAKSLERYVGLFKRKTENIADKKHWKMAIKWQTKERKRLRTSFFRKTYIKIKHPMKTIMKLD